VLTVTARDAASNTERLRSPSPIPDRHNSAFDFDYIAYFGLYIQHQFKLAQP